MKDLVAGLRNKTGLVFSWLVIVYLVFCLFAGRNELSVVLVWQLLLLSLVGSLFFTLIFETPLLGKASFVARLTLFIILCAIAEGSLIYFFGLFGITNLEQWVLFVAVILAIYGVSLGVFQIYKVKMGRRYTDLLKIYQTKE